jgi:hypothetical protein
MGQLSRPYHHHNAEYHAFHLFLKTIALLGVRVPPLFFIR